MSKGLEALEYLCENKKIDCNQAYQETEIVIECINDIEKALKEYEGAKKHIEALHKERVDNSLKIKILEIIIKKNVDVFNLKILGLQDYNFYAVREKTDELTQEEFDLLKEVLL